jgi:UTP--glucose-1-phosphate uridylyltransferase
VSVASALAAALDALPADVAGRLAAYRFDRARLIDLADRAAAGRLSPVVAGAVAPLRPGDVATLPRRGSVAHTRLREGGETLLRDGAVALVVLAGGMATRMGGGVKALAEAVDGASFLDLRLAEQTHLERHLDAHVPVWLMTSAATDDAIRAALRDRLDQRRVAVFCQSLSLRLTPDYALYRDPDGQPGAYAPGHGDLVDALRHSGLVDRFLAGGGRHLMITNIDNLGATLDPVLVGAHHAGGAAVTVEVVADGGDTGGLATRVDGRPVILEHFRLPAGYSPPPPRLFNTNTFHVDAAAIATYTAPWSWFPVRKTVDGADVVQFERLLGEITSHLDTRFVRVARRGAASRFIPVKDPAELARRRRTLAAVLAARRVTPPATRPRTGRRA